MIVRWYVRCRDCLSVASLATELPLPAELGCVCGGKVEVMGRVTRHRRLLVGTEQMTPCDDRCTMARGPKCECPCGAENHGTGLVVQIDRTEPVPRLVLLDVDTARRRAEEYRAVLDEARAAVDRTHAYGRAADQAKGRGEYLLADAWHAMHLYRDARARVQHAARLRTHAGRIKALRAIAGAAP